MLSLMFDKYLMSVVIVPFWHEQKSDYFFGNNRFLSCILICSIFGRFYDPLLQSIRCTDKLEP